MKHTLFATAFSALILLSACEKESFFTEEINASLPAGTWKVSAYNESGTDHTSDFSGYHFTFDEGGAVTVVTATDTVTGTWSATDSDDDNQTHFNLAFSLTSSPWDELTDDWHVVSQSATSLELEDVSGGNGGTDLLTFTKE